MNEDIEMEDRCEQGDINNKKYKVFHVCGMVNRKGDYGYLGRKVSKTELRVKNDIIEFQTKRMMTGKYEICLSNYKLSSDGEGCLMEVEFKNYFVIVIEFGKDYPFKPPEIRYLRGEVIDVFDMEMRLHLEILKEEEWKPILSLNDVLYEIELKLTNRDNMLVNSCCKKKKMKEYLDYNLKLMKFKDNQLLNENQIINKMKSLKLKENKRFKY